MTQGYDFIDEQANAIKKIIEIDKDINKEVSKGGNADENKITKLRFEQMLRGLYIQQDPMSFSY